MRRVLIGAAVPVAMLVLYLLLWPVPITPMAWTPSHDAGYTGPFAANTRLQGLQMLPLGEDSGPEHVVWREGWVYAAVNSGAIVRMKPDGSERQVVVRTGGRPLGFDFDAQGRLWIADPLAGSHGGLLLASGSGDAAKVQTVSDVVDGDPIRYADGVVVARNGKVYFTDASRHFGAKAFGGTFEASVLDVVEHSPSGRVLEYDPATQATRVLLTDLSFANGIALSADEQSLFVNETGSYRVWKLAVDARNVSALQPTPQARVLIDGLPGHPDNLMRGMDGRIWCGLVKPRAAFSDDNAQRPWMRSLALRLPRALWPVPPNYGHVFAFDESGKVVADLQDPKGAYPSTTAITEAPDRLYVQSLHAKDLGWLDKKAAGL